MIDREWTNARDQVSSKIEQLHSKHDKLEINQILRHTNPLYPIAPSGEDVSLFQEIKEDLSKVKDELKLIEMVVRQIKLNRSTYPDVTDAELAKREEEIDRFNQVRARYCSRISL